MTVNKHSEHAPLPSPSSQSSTPIMPYPWIMDEKARNRLLKKYRTQVASATSTVCASLAVTPLENLKTRMQMHHFKNVLECAKYLWRTEGFRGYTAGFLPPLASVTFVRVASFTSYQGAKYTISDAIYKMTGVSPLVYYNTPGSTPTFATIFTFTLGGMVAGLSTSPIACPFELAKNVIQTSVLMSTRAQASPDAVKDTSLRHKPRIGTIEAFKQIVQRHGIRGLYTGFHLHAMRDTIGTGLYFGVYETAKQLISMYSGSQPSPFGASMVAGALSGSIPWLCTYPIDTRKTRAQSVLLGKSKEIREASAAVPKSGMYKGLSVMIARTSLNNMILLSLFEYIKVKINELEA